jgi:DNA-directed RNA polymerase specialized sigma24 family protein
MSIPSVTFSVHGEKQPQFEELLLPHLGSAYNFACSLIQNERDARAIVEEAYAQATQEFETLGATDTRVWLLKTVLRIAHTRLQRQDNRPRGRLFPNGLSGNGESSADSAAGRTSDARRVR